MAIVARARSSASALVLTALVMLAASAPLSGQQAARQPDAGRSSAASADTLSLDLKDPAVALVLSGGGSRGLAHAGVLVGLERLGHDPDIVTGTSMGALVGALYAAGYSPEEIQRRIDAVDWGEMFTPAPLLLGAEQVVRYPLVSLDWESDPLRFSRGILPQWRINRALARLLFDANARARGDFDRLSRRYRAVAADLKTGDAVVLAKGDLARAVRASMAVPGVFAPVEWDGSYLVDGGIADNLPVRAALALGAEWVIGVDVGLPPDEIRERKPLRVIRRAIDLLQENAQNGHPRPDVLIRPDLPPGLQAFTFPGDPHPLFRIGLDAALRQAALAGDMAPGGSSPRPVAAPPDSLGGLIVEAPDPALEALALRTLSGIAPGPYDPDRVLAAVDRLYATGLFEAVWPRVESRDSASIPVVVVRLEAPPKLSASGAAGYDTDRGGRAWAAVQRSTSLLRSPAVLSASASVDRLEQWGALSARLFRSPSPSLVWSVGAHLQEVDVRRFAAEQGISDREVQRAGGWLGLELQHALSARIAVAVLRAERIWTGDAESGLSVGPMLRLAAQSAEAPVVGTPMEAEAEVRWGPISYRRAEVRGSREARFGELRLAAVADAAVASGGAPMDVLAALGDQHAMPGFRWGQARGPLRALAGLDAAYPIPSQGFVRTRLRVGAVADRFRELATEDSWVAGIEAGTLWQTPFGRMTISWGINSAGENNFVFDIGPQF